MHLPPSALLELGRLQELATLLPLLYIGPAVAMPIVTGLVGVLGFIVLMWGRLTALFGRAVRALRNRDASDSAELGSAPPADEPGDG